MRPPSAPRSLLILLSTVFVSSCAFYQKDFVSSVEIEGKNYRGARGDEGVFYVDDAPLTSLRLGCSRRTRLGETVFPLVPLPILREAEPHASIADQTFSLEILLRERDAFDLDAVKLTIRIGDETHPLRLVGEKKVEYRFRFEYASTLRCRELRAARLRIELGEDKIRAYSLEFDERIRRRVRYHTDFVT